MFGRHHGGQERHMGIQSGLMATAAVHATMHRDKEQGDSFGETLGYLLGMFPTAIIFAIVLDWYAVGFAWKSDFWIWRIVGTLPGLFWSLVAIVTGIAFLACAYVFTCAWLHVHLSKRSHW